MPNQRLERSIPQNNQSEKKSCPGTLHIYLNNNSLSNPKVIEGLFTGEHLLIAGEQFLVHQ